MKEQINSLLQSAWCSTYNGVDLNKATESLYSFVQDKIDEVTDSCERQLEEQYQENRRLYDVVDDLEDSVNDLNIQVDGLEYQIAFETKDIESFEEDMEASNLLLVDALEELKLYKDIQSNNPTKYIGLSDLIFRIEEQIIKNGK